jgi:hypothetical protein
LQKKNPSQDLSKSKCVLVKTNDYMIFLRIKCCTLLNGVFFVFFNILFRFQKYEIATKINFWIKKRYWKYQQWPEWMSPQYFKLSS